MASFKSTVWALFILLLLAGLGAGSAFMVSMWRQHTASKDIALAETYLAQDKAAEAEQILADRLDRGQPTGAWVDRALALRFQVLDKLKDTKAAQALAERILDPRKPWLKQGQEGWSRAHLVLAQAAIGADKPDAALPHLKAVLAQGESGWGHDDATLGLARIKMATGDVMGSQKDLAALMQRLPENAPASLRQGVEYALGLCNLNVLLSSEPQEGDEIYVLQKGDTLDRLKRKFKVSPEVIMGINRIPDARRLTIGRRIKIPHLEFSIVVNKADNTLTLYNHGKFFKKYIVRTGQTDNLTPNGDFHILNKMKDPPWRNPKDGMSYKGGEPGNELGSRWMGFMGVNVGIHEASDPNTLGKYTSNGCVGMKREDVEELYNLVPSGTPLKVTGHKVGTSS